MFRGYIACAYASALGMMGEVVVSDVKKSAELCEACVVGYLHNSGVVDVEVEGAMRLGG